MAKSKNQSIGMKKLALNNSKETDLDILKNILFDLAIALIKPNKTPTFSSNQLFNNNPTLGPVFETLGIVDSLTPIRFKSSKKQKAKGKTFFGLLNKKT